MTDIKTIWQNQPVEEKDMITLSDIRVRASAFQSRVHRRNLALYVYSLVNIALTAWLLSTGKFNAIAAPALLLMAAYLFVIWQLWWRARAQALPGDLGARAALDYLRHQLQRQHDALSKAWLWYIAPFMPGLIWELWVRYTRLHAANTPLAVDHRIAMFIMLAALCFWVAVWLAFRLAAARVEIQIERLNGLKAE
jgi:hypothetical protein